MPTIDAVALVQGFLLLMFRAAGAFMLAPVISIRSIPAQLKIGLAFLVSLALFPNQTAGNSLPMPLLPFAGAVLKETFIGVTIGFTAYLVIMAAAEIAGSVMDVQVGFRAGNAINPLTAMPASVMDQVYSLAAMLLFLVLDGHHLLLIALSDSFAVIPPGGPLDLSDLTLARITEIVSTSVSSGIRIALPVLAVTVLLDVTLAVLSKAVPQIQVFFVGIPVKFAVGLAVMLLAVPASVYLLKQLLAGMPQQIAWLVEAL